MRLSLLFLSHRVTTRGETRGSLAPGEQPQNSCPLGWGRPMWMAHVSRSHEESQPSLGTACARLLRANRSHRLRCVPFQAWRQPGGQEARRPGGQGQGVGKASPPWGQAAQASPAAGGPAPLASWVCHCLSATSVPVVTGLSPGLCVCPPPRGLGPAHPSVTSS